MSDRFLRHKQPWTSDEVQKLHRLAGKGMSLKAMSKALTRSEEIALSQTLPGGISVKVAPPMVSLHNYAINSPDPKPEHKEVLGELRHLLGKLKVNDPQVTILGHADETGDARHNERLSVRRAAAVRRPASATCAAGLPARRSARRP